MGYLRPFFSFIFVFSTKHQFNFTTNICKICPSSVWCRDSNPQPSEHESPPITTTPRFPSKKYFSFFFILPPFDVTSLTHAADNYNSRNWIWAEVYRLIMRPNGDAKSVRNLLGSATPWTHWLVVVALLLQTFIPIPEIYSLTPFQYTKRYSLNIDLYCIYRATYVPTSAKVHNYN